MRQRIGDLLRILADRIDPGEGWDCGDPIPCPEPEEFEINATSQCITVDGLLQVVAAAIDVVDEWAIRGDGGCPKRLQDALTEATWGYRTWRLGGKASG
jgi:hypothetical protein